MSVLQRFLTALLAASTIAGVLAVGTTSASARVEYDGVYSLSYTDSLIYSSRGCDCFYELDYQGWLSLGQPTPKRIASDFVKYPWSPTIYAVTFFGPDQEDWLWSDVRYSEWKKAGFPQARNAGWIEGSYFYKYELNDDIMVTAPDNSTHALSAREWRDAGYPSPDVQYNQGYIKPSWTSDILFQFDAQRGSGFAVTYGQWRDDGFPTPKIVHRIPGDRVYKYSWSGTIYYEGGGLWKELTLQEWQRMGAPRPQVI